MGYYTGKETNKSPKGNRGWLWPIIIGLIAGAAVMYFLNVRIPDDNIGDSKEHTDKTEKGETSLRDENVNVNVSTQITDVVDKISDAVVGITNIQTRGDFWMEEEADEAGTGSGVIYKEDNDYAYIVSNHHVVEDADMLEVVLGNNEHLEAELLGSDLFTDLAVLRVDSSKVDGPIKLGSSSNLKVGEPVIAIGNPLGHMFAGSVTQGIISGKKRTIPQDFNQDGQPDWQAEVIQTDAAINPGNSGGALINLEGQLIGINSMKVSQDIAQGIGFAIPVDTATPIMEQLEKNGVVKRPSLGVEIYSLEEVPQVEWSETLNLPDSVDGGVYIWHVNQMSAANKAGLKRLDVITEFDGESITDILDLRKILYQEKEVGDEVDIVYYRDGQKKKVTLTLGEEKQ
ncbi:MAG TPA: S1C family serine protease [Pseudogracilibacillus sp.]|nr:S1C family serine protease [Pseudogracilibacillus sp.]